MKPQATTEPVLILSIIFFSAQGSSKNQPTIYWDLLVLSKSNISWKIISGTI
jgi:hypothetical protein